MPRGTARVYRAREAFVATMENGDVVPIKKGDLFRDGHPILKRRESLFELTDMVRADVEQATAAPGEKRDA